jgi:hypothetical protein
MKVEIEVVAKEEKKAVAIVIYYHLMGSHLN